MVDCDQSAWLSDNSPSSSMSSSSLSSTAAPHLVFDTNTYQTEVHCDPVVAVWPVFLTTYYLQIPKPVATISYQDTGATYGHKWAFYGIFGPFLTPVEAPWGNSGGSKWPQLTILDVSHPDPTNIH